MAIIDKPFRQQIDITGPAGNAFALLGLAEKLAKQLGKDADQITKKMQSGNYENLISVFDEEFGEFIDLVR
jgi:hypothetical protein